MSNIRPIGDSTLAAAMAATFQSIDAARSAPSGISTPRWRILQCIAQAAPNVPSMGELRLCSGLNKAALAEHLQALRWKGLVEMGGLRLSPSAAEMVGLKPVIIGMDFSSQPDASAKVAGRYRADGGIEVTNIEFVPPLEPGDVPACMRADCLPPEKPIEEVRDELFAKKLCESRENDRAGPCNEDALGSLRRVEDQNVEDGGVRRALRSGHAASFRQSTETEARLPDTAAAGQGAGQRSAPRRRKARADDAGRGSRDTATPGAATDKASLPLVGQPSPPKFVNWIEQRQARIAGAIAFLGSLGIPVVVADRGAEIRTYFLSANRRSLFAEEVIEFAIEKGWSE